MLLYPCNNSLLQRKDRPKVIWGGSGLRLFFWSGEEVSRLRDRVSRIKTLDPKKKINEKVVILYISGLVDVELWDRIE